MKKVILAAVIMLATSVPAYAQDAAVIVALQKRVLQLEETALEQSKKLTQSHFLIEELERKMAGVQKQVTVLHAKKADAEVEGAARLNADGALAESIQGISKRVDGLTARTELYSKRVEGLKNASEHNGGRLIKLETGLQETRDQTANCLRMMKTRHADFVKWAEGVDKKLNNR